MKKDEPEDMGKPLMAGSKSEDGKADQLMEKVCEQENIAKALRRTLRNKGTHGVDGMTLKDLPDWLEKNWPVIEKKLLEGSYLPKPVKEAEIPKPGGGTRRLGIPTVLDRLIQQAILQLIQPIWEPTFSEHSYGFRPGRSAHMAIARAQEYIKEGYDFTVDIDLEKFFDNVNHDRLMAAVARRIEDKRLLGLLRAYLNSGIMSKGIEEARTKGTPQGGPLSPLLSNIVLDELDRELEDRGHHFVRYADDLRIYMRSEKAAYRVMKSVSWFIRRRLKLKVNETKSAVAKSWERKFLGFSFTFT
jgi:RNA-directed DNA polymerase